jgi:hypothetical protein
MSTVRSRKPDCILNPGTFGGTKACHHLVDMMNANVVPPFEKRRILSLIASATYNFKWLSIIPEFGVKYRTMTLMRDDIYARIEKWTYDEKVKSLTRNVINHHYRRYVEEAAWAIAP